MKLIKFIKDVKSELNLPPLFGLPNGLKAGEVRYKKGTKMIVTNSFARYFVKKQVDLELYEKTGKWKIITSPAIIIKELGRHIGRSKHIYLKNGKSEVYA